MQLHNTQWGGDGKQHGCFRLLLIFVFQRTHDNLKFRLLERMIDGSDFYCKCVDYITVLNTDGLEFIYHTSRRTEFAL